MSDQTLLTSLTALAKCLRHARTDDERKAIIASMRTARHLAERRAAQPKTGGLSTLARRILAKCQGQTLHIRTIAHLCGKSPDGSTFKGAMRELIKSQQARKASRGTYLIVTQPKPPAKRADEKGGILDLEKNKKTV